MPFIVNITKNFRIILRSNLENGFPMLGFYFPKWKMISQCWDSIFQNGKRFPNVRILFSKMENNFPMLGFHFPKWRTISQYWDFIFQNGE